MPVNPDIPAFLLKFNEKANFALLDTPEGVGFVNGFEDNGLYNQMVGPFTGGPTGWNFIAYVPVGGLPVGEDHNDWAAGGSGSDTLVGDTDGDLSCEDEDDPSKGDNYHTTDTGDVLYGGSGYFLDRGGKLQDKIDAHDDAIPPGANDGENSTQPPSFDNTKIDFDISTFDLARIFADDIEAGLLPDIDRHGDELIGGRDNDTVFGQLGDDTIDGGGGRDYLFGGRGADLMDGDYLGEDNGYEPEDVEFTLDSPSGEQTTITINTADYRQDGKECDDGDEGDTMFGGKGKDTMFGGDDSMPLSPTSYVDDTFTGTDGQTCFIDSTNSEWGWPYDFAVWTSGKGVTFDGDWMHGNGGRDFMNGEEGFDTMYGGVCNDTMLGSYHYDLMFGGKGSDLLLGGTEASDDGGEDTGDSHRAEGACETRCAYEGNWNEEFPDTVNGVEILRGGDTMFGGRGFDTMWGGRGDDLMYGGRHSDCMYGGDDDDRMEGEHGADFMSGGEGWDDMDGGSWDDTMNGDAGDDWMAGRTGSDVMGGGTGNDIMRGGEDNDVMSGDGSYASLKSEEDGTEDVDGDSVIGGNDIMYGGDGDDIMDGNGGADVMFGENDMDVMNGGDGNDTMYGGDDMDVMNGGDGEDCMHGDAGRDFVYGSEDNDKIDGGLGVDTLIGGDGDDIIWLNGQEGSSAALREMATGDGGLNPEASGSDTFVYNLEYEEVYEQIEVPNGNGDGNDTINGDGDDFIDGEFLYSTASGTSGYVQITDFSREDVLQLCVDGDINDCCAGEGDVNDPKFDDYEAINARLIEGLSRTDGQMGITVYDGGTFYGGTFIIFDDTVPTGNDPSEPEIWNDESIFLQGVTGLTSGYGLYADLSDLVADGYDIRIATDPTYNEDQSIKYYGTTTGGDEWANGESPVPEGWDKLVACEIDCGNPGCDVDPFDLDLV